MTSEEKNNKVAQFFEKEENKLINYVKSLFNFRYSSLAPEDIVQDIALTIFDRVDFEAHIGNIAAYVYRSIRNKLIDIQRKKTYEVSYDNVIDENGENYFLSSIADEMIPEEVYREQIEMEEKAYKAIDQLKPDYRDIIVATELEGNSFDALSKAWNVPIGTLLSRKHRAIAQLQKMLQNNDSLNT